jgi:hypothetical protein
MNTMRIQGVVGYSVFDIPNEYGVMKMNGKVAIEKENCIDTTFKLFLRDKTITTCFTTTQSIILFVKVDAVIVFKEMVKTFFG